MDQVSQSFQDFFARMLTSAPQLTAGIFVIIFFIFLGRFFTRATKKMLSLNEQTGRKRKIILRLIRWSFYGFGFTVALNIMGLTDAAGSILAAGGIVTVVLGFAFREIGENLLAGLFMSFSPIFDVGDLIESNGTRGVVKKINIRDVHIRTADGVDSFVPSAMIYKNQLHNYTRDGIRRGRFIIGIDYKNDPKKARELIFKTIQSIEGVLEIPKVSVQIAEFSANYMELECFFWINIYSEHANLAEMRSVVMETVRQTLLDNDFTLSSEVLTTIEVSERK